MELRNSLGGAAGGRAVFKKLTSSFFQHASMKNSDSYPLQWLQPPSLCQGFLIYISCSDFSSKPKMINCWLDISIWVCQHTSHTIYSKFIFFPYPSLIFSFLPRRMASLSASFPSQPPIIFDPSLSIIPHIQMPSLAAFTC